MASPATTIKVLFTLPPFMGWGFYRHVASASSGPAPLAHRRSARPKGLDRAPGPLGALAPAARASSPLGDFARRDPGCDRFGERRELSALTLSATGRALPGFSTVWN